MAVLGGRIAEKKTEAAREEGEYFSFAFVSLSADECHGDHPLGIAVATQRMR